MNIRRHFFLMFSLLASLPAMAVEKDTAAPEPLALQLVREKDYTGAALEYRRTLESASTPEERGGWHWASAWAYLRGNAADRAEKQLDAAEEVTAMPAAPTLWLRAESAESRKEDSAAVYFWKTLAANGDLEYRRFASLRLSAHELRNGRTGAARDALALSPADEQARREILENYLRAPRKSPTIGGLLGLIPGVGYAYSGEYSNAARSAILNGLFIWIMARTAQDDSWGAFALASFFELTWYSGSIYGGIDAAHRYNQRLLQEAEQGLLEGVRAEPEPIAFPIIQVRFRF